MVTQRVQRSSLLVLLGLELVVIPRCPDPEVQILGPIGGEVVAGLHHAVHLSACYTHYVLSVVHVQGALVYAYSITYIMHYTMQHTTEHTNTEDDTEVLSRA